MGRFYSGEHAADSRIVEKAILQSEYKESGLFGGELGTALYCISRIASSDTYAKRLNTRLTKSIDFAIHQFKSPKHNNPVNLGNGLTGLAFVLNRIKYVLRNSATNSTLTALESNIYTHAVQANQGGLLGVDYFFGLTGVANYYVSLSRHPNRIAMTEHLCDQIIDQSNTQNGKRWWTDDHEFSLKPHNLGMAHGILSIISVLSKASYTLGLKKYNPVISEAVSWLMLQENSAECISHFSHSTDGINENCEKTWLSWCYGDLGVSIALLHAFKATGNKRFNTDAIRILSSSVKRADPKQEVRNDKGLIYDVGLCHGITAICAAYYVLARFTKDKQVQDAFNSWLLLLLKRAPKGLSDSTARCYKVGMLYEEAQTKEDITLLEGTAGLGLLYCSLASKRADKVWMPLFHLDI